MVHGDGGFQGRGPGGAGEPVPGGPGPGGFGGSGTPEVGNPGGFGGPGAPEAGGSNGFGAQEAGGSNGFGDPPGNRMTAFPPSETGFFPAAPQVSAAGFQAAPAPQPEPRVVLGSPAPNPNPAPDKRRRALLIGASVAAVVGVTAGAIALSGGGGDGSKQPVANSTPEAVAATSAAADPAAGGTPSARAGDVVENGPSSSNRDGKAVPGGPGAPTASPTPSAPGAKPSPTPAGTTAAPAPGGHSTSNPPAPGTTVPAPVVAPVPDVLHWRLGETGGTTAADTSGRGLTGTAGGAAAFDPAQHGGSVFFNGPANQIKGGEVATKGPVIDTAKSFTISMWMNQTGITTPTKYTALFSQDGTQNFAFTLSYSTESKTWSFVRADNDATTPVTIGVGAKTPVPLNSWHQLTGVYDAQAGTVALYVDGAPQGTAKTGTAPYAAAGPFAIGRSWYQKYPSNPFNGYISDVRVYGRALSAAEVKAQAQ